MPDTKVKPLHPKFVKIKREVVVTCEAIRGHYLEVQRLCKKPATEYEVDGVTVLLCEEHSHLATGAP
ncbi:MAG TPA: hypothetical protein VFQ06_15555 [Nitrospira sp.]|nr:hypothetical protein [Nitrospira sp.]